MAAEANCAEEMRPDSIGEEAAGRAPVSMRMCPELVSRLHALQVGAHLGGVLVAQVAILLESFVDDLFELRRNVGIEADAERRSAIQNRVEDDCRGFAAERQRAGRHLVEHGAEGKQVGAGVEFLAARLLGRHVGDRADGGAGAGEVLFDGAGGHFRRRASGQVGVLADGHLGQAEVENLGVAALGHKNVCRLDVAVDDAFGCARRRARRRFRWPSDRSFSSSMGRPAIRCFRVTPSRNSMAMKASPSCSPMS